MEILRDRVEALSVEALLPVVRRALADDQLGVLGREVSQLGWAAINPITRGLFRISGTARRSSGDITPWLVVLKVVGDADLIDTGYCHEPTDWNYWKREALAFRSGLLDGWPGPLWPVRAYAVDDVAEDEVWIWLQACGDARAKTFAAPGTLASTAHDLGVFAAQWAPAPPNRDQYPWLAHRWVDGWVRTFRALGVDHAVGHDGCWTTALLRDVLTGSTRRRAAEVLTAADLLQQRLASLPLTLAHHDTQWSNAFPAEESGLVAGTVMIDWSFLGLAPVGTDLGLHVAGNLTSGAVNPDRAADHDRSATDAYLRGLREHGWAGPSEAVLFARAASASLVAVTWVTAQVSWLCPEMISMIGSGMSSWPQTVAQRLHTDVATVMAGWATTFDFVLDLGDEAMRLLDTI
jgi:hypothetical protein